MDAQDKAEAIPVIMVAIVTVGVMWPPLMLAVA